MEARALFERERELVEREIVVIVEGVVLEIVEKIEI